MAQHAKITGPLTKSSLAKAVAIELDVSRQEGARAVDAVLDVIAQAVASGYNVSVPRFGTWKIELPSRESQGKASGDSSGRMAVAFQPARQLKQKMDANMATPSV